MSPPEVDSTKDIEKKPSQRRINKPLIEKRRRARINESLAQLKSIVLEATDSKGPRPSKLEKADILEMTVEFIKSKTPTHMPATDKDTTKDATCHLEDQTEYSAGYAKCLGEISRYLEETKAVNDVSKKLVEHISHKLQSRDQIQSNTNQSMPTNGKMQNKPIPKYIPIAKIDNTQQAVDLSLHRKRDGQKDSTNVQQQTLTETVKSDSTLMGQVINQQLPVGLVCGSHMMLLLQVPNSMTPSQEVMSFLPQLQTISGSSIPASFRQVPQVPVVINQAPNVIPKTPEVKSQLNVANDQNQCVVIPCPNDSASVSINKNSAADLNKDSANVDVKAIPNDKQISDANHWRPW